MPAADGDAKPAAGRDTTLRPGRREMPRRVPGPSLPPAGGQPAAARSAHPPRDERQDARAPAAVEHAPPPAGVTDPTAARPHPPSSPRPTEAGAPRPLESYRAGSDQRPPADEPPLRAALPNEPFHLPEASWGWGLALVGLLVGAAPQLLLALPTLLSGSSLDRPSRATTLTAVALVIGSLVFYGWQVFATWLFSLGRTGRSLAAWGLRRPTRTFFWLIPAGLFATYAVSTVHNLIASPKEQAIMGEFPRSPLGAVLFILLAVVMAPLAEEIVYRGFLFRGLANSLGWEWGAAISAAIFGAAHLQLDVFVPLTVLGFVLAWVYQRSGSLWTSVVLHALFNLIAVATWAFLG